MRRYVPSDYADLKAWHEAHGYPAPAEDRLPPTGFIEPGVALGFLYCTDSALAFVDMFTSNPAASSMARGRALVAINRELVAEAKRRGFQGCMAITREPGIARAAQRNGYRPLGQFAMLYAAIDLDEPATSSESGA